MFWWFGGNGWLNKYFLLSTKNQIDKFSLAVLEIQSSTGNHNSTMTQNPVGCSRDKQTDLQRTENNVSYAG